MGDVADERDLQAFQAAQRVPHGQEVQQALCGMFVGAVARVDDDRVRQALREEKRGARRGMTHHHTVHLHGLYVPCRVAQGFSLGHAAAGGSEIQRVRGELLLGQFEGQPRAGARFEEEVDDVLPPQGGDLAYGAPDHFLEGVRRIKDEADFRAGVVLEADQVPVAQRVQMIFTHHTASSTATLSFRSSSWTCTTTVLPGPTSMCSPT